MRWDEDGNIYQGTLPQAIVTVPPFDKNIYRFPLFMVMYPNKGRVIAHMVSNGFPEEQVGSLFVHNN